ncbi:MAG: hypothetical protein DYH13_00355 [Alphaproteobacteria bacterium PRO2]|nr:hypothetical protein [Alphaproteobacteria bacterium PRO2]
MVEREGEEIDVCLPDKNRMQVLFDQTLIIKVEKGQNLKSISDPFEINRQRFSDAVRHQYNAISLSEMDMNPPDITLKRLFDSARFDLMLQEQGAVRTADIKIKAVIITIDGCDLGEKIALNAS